MFRRSRGRTYSFNIGLGRINANADPTAGTTVLLVVFLLVVFLQVGGFLNLT